MKYTVLTPLKHNGKRLEAGATLGLEEGAATDRLVELGAVEPAPTAKTASQPPTGQQLPAGSQPPADTK